ncbi:Heterokaryon incompatibility protein (HET) domain containing protein [Naviculisporaceae sp. PSN 640]
MMASYPYRVLPAARHIRLLVLRPGPTDVIHCDMQVVNLDHDPLYDCLSYCWSGPRNQDTGEEWTNTTNTITIDDTEVSVWKNLFNALKSFRDLGLISPLWVDAVCINQDDLAERMSQVALMANIYGGAREVLVWLGHEDQNTEIAVNSMSQLTFTWEQFIPGLDKDPDISGIQQDFVRCKFTDAQLSAMILFFVDNVWFSRVWTLQEMLLARSLRFVCGHVMVSLEAVWRASAIVTMHSAASSIWHQVHQLPEFARARTFFDDVNDARIRVMGRDGPSSIGILAHKHRERNATDPRDKVYGLLALSRTSTKTHIKPIVADYSLDVHTVFTKAAVFGLLAWEGWETLGFVGDRNENKIPNLPSWVPDYTQGMPWKPLQRSPCRFRVTPPSETTFSYEEDWPGCLVAPYHRFDTVAATCPAYWDFDDTVEYSHIVNMFNLVLCPKPIQANGSKDLLEALALTLIADKVEDSHEVHRDIPRQFAMIAFCQLLHVALKCDPNIERLLNQGDGDLELVLRCLTAAGIKDDQAKELVTIPLIRLLGPGLSRVQSKEERSLWARGLENAPVDLSLYVAQTRISFRVDWLNRAGNRYLFRTERGYLGLGPRTIKVGDQVGLLQGAQVPYIFRHQEKDPETVLDLVGESYVHGIMYGELGSGLEYHKITLY